MNKTIYKIGFLSGLIAFISTAAFVIVQLMQLLGFLRYPWDEILIYGTSLCIVIPFVLEILSLHYITPDKKKFWTHAALKLDGAQFMELGEAPGVLTAATVRGGARNAGGR